MQLNKPELRKSLLQKRKDIVQKQEKDSLIAEKLFKSKFFIQSDSVFIYCSTEDEVDTRLIINRSLESGKMVCLPRVLDKKGMSFFKIKGFSELEKSKFGILEPKNVKNKINLPGINTLFIVPGLSFDYNGNRMGYGGGYYDRYMRRIDCLKVGLCYEELITSAMPVEDHDEKVDLLVTDKNIYSFQG